MAACLGRRGSRKRGLSRGPRGTVLEARGGGRGVGDLHDGETELEYPGEKNAVLNADAGGSFRFVICAWYFGRKSFLVNMGFEVFCQYLVPSGLRMSFLFFKIRGMSS